MATQTLQIVDGPSKFDLMLGLFDGNCANPRTVRFVILDRSLDKITMSVLLNGISKEDGGGENWLLTGLSNGKLVRGFFSTKTRKGHLEFS